MNGEDFLGYTMRDRITGFKGVSIGHCKYLTGCNQTLLQPASTGDGGVKPESHWFDDQRLEIYNDIEPVVLDNGSTPGCDKPAPKC